MRGLLFSVASAIKYEYNAFECNGFSLEIYPQQRDGTDEVLSPDIYQAFVEQLDQEICEHANSVGTGIGPLAIVHGEPAALEFTSNLTEDMVYQGVIWLGTTTPRTYRNGHSFPYRSASIMGDLDGRERVTRLAEELYHTENYMTIIEGMNNHVAFYVENADLEWMQEDDLQAEITQSDALQQMAEFSAHFLFFVQSTISAPATRYLWEKRNTASDYLAPVIMNFNLENSFYFGGYNQIGPDWNPLVCPTVWRGDRGLCEARAAPWAIFAQEYVSGFYPKETSELYQAGYRYYVDGEYASLNSRPSDPCPACIHHLPNITVDASDEFKLYNTIYTQNVWIDEEDYASSHTLKAKLYSRQCTYRNSGYLPDAGYDIDDGLFCKEINKLAYDETLERIKHLKSYERFTTHGVPYKMTDDKIVIAGPSWSDFNNKFTEIVENGKVTKIEIESRSLKTSADIPNPDAVPDPRCYHYCHLLSPARIIEYIYTDSLRYNLSA